MTSMSVAAERRLAGGGLRAGPSRTESSFWCTRLAHGDVDNERSERLRAVRWRRAATVGAHQLVTREVAGAAGAPPIAARRRLVWILTALTWPHAVLAGSCSSMLLPS